MSWMTKDWEEGSVFLANEIDKAILEYLIKDLK